MLEAVQRRAVRQVRGISGTYEDKLKQCGLTLLRDRRQRGDMIQTFKIINQVDDVPINTFFKISGSDHQHATRGAVTVNDPEEEVHPSNMNIAKPKAEGEIRRNFFSHRVVDNWNKLPADVKSATSVNDFKNMYDSSVS